MNLKLVETLLVSLFPLFATTLAAHTGVTPPEHEVERKIRGSDSQGTEDILTDLPDQNKPNPLKGADGGISANHAHGGRMLAKMAVSRCDDGFEIGAGVLAGGVVDSILDQASSWYHPTR